MGAHSRRLYPCPPGTIMSSFSILAYATGRTFWLPPKASTFADSHDALFNTATLLGVGALLIVAGALVFFGLKFKRAQDGQKTSDCEGDFRVQLAFAAISALGVLFVFAGGFKGYVNMKVAPGDAYIILAEASDSDWTFTYPTGEVTNEALVLPVDQPIRLQLSSADEVHGFYIPAFRVNREVFPGRYTSLWFEPTQEGTYSLLCSEYCGPAHANMNKSVQVMSSDAFQAWLDSQVITLPEGMTYPEWGEQLFVEKTCSACHSTDGSRLVGPTMQGLFGSEREFTSTPSRIADEEYLRHSITDPNADIVAGFAPTMPALPMQDEELRALVEYIKTFE